MAGLVPPDLPPQRPRRDEDLFLYGKKELDVWCSDKARLTVGMTVKALSCWLAKAISQSVSLG
jgi:hypothetical protein